MRIHLCLITTGLALSLSALSAPAADKVVGWMNDGTGYFPGQQIVDHWDANSGENILWKARMPNWSNSSPIIIDGRVFVMSEPFDYAPLLLCIDAETGKELWRREVDPVLTIPPGQRKAVRDLLSKTAGWQRKFRRYIALTQLDDPPADLDKQMTEAGVEGAYPKANPPRVKLVRPHPYADLHEQVKRLRLQVDHWTFEYGTHGRPLATTRGTWTGFSYPTPVSDGKHVWVLTAQNIVACYDMEGRLAWIRRFAHPRDVKFTDEEKAWILSGKYRSVRQWSGKVPGDGAFSTSPLLLDGKLILNAGNFIRVLAADSGKTLWDTPSRFNRGQGMSVPQIADLPAPGGKTVRVIITGDFGDVHRLSDGKHLGGPLTLPTKGKDAIRIFDGHCAMVDSYKTPGRGLKLSLDANGKLEVKELWKKERFKDVGSFPWRLVIVGGKGVAAKGVVDLKTGQVQARGLTNAHAGYVWSMSVVAGDQLLQVAANKGHFCVRGISSDENAAKLSLPLNPEGGVPQKLKYGSAAKPGWSIAGAGTPFIYENRIYYRSFDFLWCIGRR